ncbi:MAG: HD domain-containing protein [Oscillospiraceae bacterium]|nr:HD domain-containing protein [Oscillospiraceae bacterium]
MTMKSLKKTDNGRYEGFAVVRSFSIRTTAKNLPYADLVLADSEEEISAKLWDYSAQVHGTYTPGQLIKVRGTIDIWNEKEQLKIERIRLALPADGVRIEDYVPSAPFSPEKMLEILTELAGGFSDRELSGIVLYLLGKYKEQLLYFPAAVKMHHAVRGGLLFHVLSVVRLAEQICALYPSVDRDLLLSGAILHDISKTAEYSATNAGVAEEYTVKGNLLGHLVMGAGEVTEAGKATGASEETVTLLCHMILSHHGIPEYGSAQRPAFLEAEILSILDNLDAEIYEITDAVSKTAPGTFSERQWGLDNRRFLNHNRKPLAPPDLMD